MNERDISRILKPGLAESLSEVAEACGLHNRKTDSLIRSASYREDKRRLEAFARFNKKRINKVDEKAIPFLPPSEDADIGGDIILGNDFYFGSPVGIKLSELTRPFAIFGATGYYKTITMINMAVQLAQRNIALIIIDRKGRQFRCLQAAFPEKTAVLKANGEFAYNPISLKNLARVVEIRSAVFQRHDSSNIFLETARNELRKYTACEHDIHNAIVRINFKKWLSDMRKLQSSLLAISSGIVFSPFGNTLAYRKGFDFSYLIENKIENKGILVIEADECDSIHLEYLLSEIVNDVQSYLRSGQLEHDELKVVIMLDEGTEIFRERKEIPPIVEMSGKIRQSGTALIVGLHAFHLCHSLFRSQIYAMCCYRVSSGESIECIRKTYFLDPEKAAYIAQQPIQQGFVILGDRYPEPIPFVALNPLVKYDLNIPDEFRIACNKEFMKKHPPLEPWKGEILTVIVEDDEFDLIPIKQDGESDTNKEISDKERTLLDYILNRFDIPLTSVYKELGFSMQEGNDTSSSVIRKNLATPVWLNSLGGQGNLCKYLFHTQKYFAITGKEKPLVSGTDAKGPEHYLMLRFLLKNLEVKQCTEIKVSRVFENAVCDAYFRYKGLSYIVEACSTTIKTEEGKINRILKSSDVEYAFVVVKDRKILEAVQKEIEDSPIKDRIICCLLSGFLNSDIETLTGKNREV